MTMFAFKGMRNYLHGTDFYRHTQLALMPHIASDFHISQLTFRKFAHNQCELLLNKPQTQQIVCSGRVLVKDKRLVPFWWVETSQAVTTRYSFNEDTIVLASEIDKLTKTIFITKPDGEFSCIELIVAMTKSLHNVVSPLMAGKWVFGQLDLISPLNDDYATLRVSINSLFKGRFSVSTIYLNETKIGQIRFIVGEPS